MAGCRRVEGEKGALCGPADAPGARGVRDEREKCSFLSVQYEVRKCY